MWTQAYLSFRQPPPLPCVGAPRPPTLDLGLNVIRKSSGTQRRGNEREVRRRKRRTFSPFTGLAVGKGS